MKSAAITLAILAVMATAALAQSGDVGVPINPVGPGSSAPSVHLSARAVDIGIDIDGSGSSINPTDFRPGSYAFTGERIIYVVVVRDQNGVQDIENVHWMRDGSLETICTDVTEFVDDVDPSSDRNCNDNQPVDSRGCGYYMTLDRTELVKNGVCDDRYCEGNDPVVKVEIDTSTNLQWDQQIDKLYKCVVEVESNWDGVDEIAVHATDKSGEEGMTVPEMWNFNPPLVVDIDTSDGEPLSFGAPILDQDAVFVTDRWNEIDGNACINTPNEGREDLTYRDCTDYVACDGNGEAIDCDYREPFKKCDVSFSTNKLKITNVGEVNLWAFIASEDFHATEGAAKCPYDNTLSANQFEYRAMSGSYDSGWRLMPEYSPNLGCAGIGLGDSTVANNNLNDLVFGQCRGGCRIPAGGPGFTSGGEQTNPPIPGLDILSPTHHIEVALKIVWPTPCIGTFDEGNVHVLVRAV